MATKTETEKMTIQQFVERHGITIEYKPTDRNPVMDDDEWSKEAAHWRVTLKCGDRSMSLVYSKGSGLRVWHRRYGGSDYGRPEGAIPGQKARLPWNPSTYDKRAFMAWTDPEPPTVAEVLDNLASGASSADQSFEDWCSDFGYDTDSRKAERTYSAVREQTFSLRKLLGHRDFEALLQNVERM
jgi:hypothetical protein